MVLIGRVQFRGGVKAVFAMTKPPAPEGLRAVLPRAGSFPRFAARASSDLVYVQTFNPDQLTKVATDGLVWGCLSVIR